MSLWLGLVLVGQFLLATVAIIDKYIVGGKTTTLRPFTYTFWLCILSSGTIFVYLFSWVPIPIAGLEIPSFANVQAPSLYVFALAITAAYAFFTALLSMFTALTRADASDVVPVIGAANAVATFVLGFYFLGTTLSDNFLYGFVLLVVGTVLTSRFRLDRKTMLSTLHAGLMFGVHYVAIKALFLATNFDTAFFWSRLAIVLMALSMLLIPYYYDKVMERTRATKRADGLLLIGNKLLGGLASIVLLKAIDIGDVALVQALGGLQYLFLLGFSACCGRYLAMRKAERRTWHDRMHNALAQLGVYRAKDEHFSEAVTVRSMFQKTLSVACIVLGLFLLFL